MYVGTQDKQGAFHFQISIFNCQLNGNRAVPVRQESSELSSAGVWVFGYSDFACLPGQRQLGRQEFV